MGVRTLGGLLALWSLAIGLAAFWPVPAAPPAPNRSAQAPAPVHSPARVASRTSVSATPAGRSSARGPRPRGEPLRSAYDNSRDLTRFVQELLPAAAQGDGASQYFLYLALDECRGYLVLDATTADGEYERLLGVGQLNAEERLAWHSTYERCRGFAGFDWSLVHAALGRHEPMVEAEYGSLWFERAVRAGYPPALAEQALRPGLYGAEERERLLSRALPGGSAEVYWLLFAHSDPAHPSGSALAWLLVACRAGYDCSEGAVWHRAIDCLPEARGCQPGESALAHYWRTATAEQRTAAEALAQQIEADLAAGRWDRLPRPDLAWRDLEQDWSGPRT